MKSKNMSNECHNIYIKIKEDECYFFSVEMIGTIWKKEHHVKWWTGDCRWQQGLFCLYIHAGGGCDKIKCIDTDEFPMKFKEKRYYKGLFVCLTVCRTNIRSNRIRGFLGTPIEHTDRILATTVNFFNIIKDCCR